MIFNFIARIIRSRLIRACTVFTLAVSLNAFAHDCEEALTETARISAALEQVPVLRQYVLDLLDDPKVRMRLLSFLRRALIKENPSVFQLSDELREKWNIPSRLTAFAYTNYKIPMISYKSQQKSANAQFSADQRRNDKPFGVYVSDRPFSPERNDLMSLLHELAHVRFNAFLKENYDKICRRLPSSFATILGDECLILDELIDLMGEKFAFGMQYELVAEVHRRLFPMSNTRAIDLKLFSLSPRARMIELGRSISRTYDYAAPHVRAAADLSLAQILLGGPALQDIDQAVQLYSDPGRALPSAEEMPAALGIVQYMKYIYRDGAGDSGRRMLSLICSSLSDIASLPDGVARIKAVLKGADLLAGEDPRMRAAYHQVNGCFGKAGQPPAQVYLEVPVGTSPVDFTLF